MKEKKQIRVRVGTVICLSVIFILILGILGIWYYNNAADVNKDNNTDVPLADNTNIIVENNNEKQFLENKEIELLDSDKISINEKLDALFVSVRIIINYEYRLEQAKIEYDKNLLDYERNKFFIVLDLMWNDEGLENSFIDKRAEGSKGNGTLTWAIDDNIVNQYYNEIFGTDMDEVALLDSNMPCEISIKNGILYGVYQDIGDNPFVLKAKSLVLNEKTEIYTLTADLLQVIKNGDSLEEIDSYIRTLVECQDAGLLTWDASFNYAKLKIEYKKETNENYKLISLMFVN